MVSINTNLSSMIVQQNLTKSTNALNLAIERMTTGFKINHASDNAANYSISNDMASQLSSYDVAADNISMGLDMVNTAQDSIALMQSRAERLMDLWNQAQNGTYGSDSLRAIQQEANALVQEIDRLYSNTEYNGMNLLGYDLPSWAQEVRATAGVGATESERHHIEDSVVDGYKHVSELTTSTGFSGATTFAITTVEDLANLATLVNAGKDSSGKTFVMGADLDLSAWCAEHMDPDGVGGWNAIGSYEGYNENKVFKGTFDGNGHVISGLTINKTTSNFQGLFGYTSNTSTIKNIGVEGCNVNGNNYVGGLVGQSDGTIESSYSTGDVSGNTKVGGLEGSSRVSIESSYSTGDVNGNNSVGGLAGYSEGSIESSYSTGDVSGNDCVGGLVGNSYGVTIESSYSTGNVRGNNLIGGIIGGAGYYTYSVSITDVFSSGHISGVTQVGGIAGNIDFPNTSTFTNIAYNQDLNNSLGAIGNGTNYTVSNLEKVSLSSTTLQVGIHGDSSSRISFTSGINLSLDVSDISQTSTYDSINNFLNQLSDRATELGAISNRLQSALDSTMVSIENLTSSLSTIRDADVAKESSAYIRSQILQQASATLLATANQSPSIALQLI